MTYEYYEPPMGYDEIVSIQGEIVKDWIIGDWQGDYVYLLKNNDWYSLVVVGYGSCSGCDALEACENNEEFELLKQSILNDIRWGSKQDILDQISDEEINRWYFHESEWKDIAKEIREILNA